MVRYFLFLLFLLLIIPAGLRAQAPPTWQQLSSITHVNGARSRITAQDAYDWQTIYVAGEFEGTIQLGGTQLTSAGGVDGFVARWDLFSNSFTWAARFGGVGTEQVADFEVNGTQAYIVGSFRSPTAAFGNQSLALTGTGGKSDGFVVSLDEVDRTPYFAWAQSVQGPEEERLTSIYVNGRLLVVGGEFSSATATLGTFSLTNTGVVGSREGIVALLDDNSVAGSFRWVQAVTGPGDESVTAVTLQPRGLYFAGEFTSSQCLVNNRSLTHSSPGAGRDLFMGAVALSGITITPTWAYAVGGPGDDQASSITVFNGLALTGSFRGQNIRFGPLTLTNTDPSGLTSDAFLVKASDDGVGATFAWALKAGGAGNDRGRRILRSNTLYWVGDFEGIATIGPHRLTSAGATDAFITKVEELGSSAAPAWAQRAGGPGADEACAVLPGFQERFYMGGSATPPAQFSALTLSGSSSAPVGYLAVLFDIPSLRVSITGDTLVCTGSQVQLTAQASPTVQSYRWSTGATTPSITVSQPGVYSVTVTFNSGETRTAQHTVTSAAPVIRVTGDTVLCSGSTGQLQATAAGATAWRWNTGATTATLSMFQPGTYTVTAQFGSGCTRTQQVLVRPASLTITGPDALCAGAPALLTAVAPGATAYRWNTGATTASLPITQPGSYSVEALFPSGCRLTASYQVSVPAARIAGDSVGCAGQPVRLRATQRGATAYLWNTGAADSVLTVSQSGTYSVLVTYGRGCQQSARHLVRILPTLPIL
ncbi:hypothetical protein [Hymenobacter rigui]|uniref:Ig-like domain-containing protein n=1 Tax=Hymenobacter rigui TaxID=334424 RepID=A0A428K9K9_9BACT|nr:hypothetical protein [Hymenobacter rigui]RSK43154.1 hypothetical protein EI291_22090 [Hymenobacter rigui]